MLQWEVMSTSTLMDQEGAVQAARIPNLATATIGIFVPKEYPFAIMILGGVPLYNTMMNTTTHNCRFFWSRIDAEFDADRKMQNLDMEKWKEVETREISGFPTLPDTITEIEHLTQKTVSWRVHVYENFTL